MVSSLLGGKKEQGQSQEQLRVLATQIEAINQQLSQGVSGSGSRDVQAKLAYLYEFMEKSMAQITAERKQHADELRGIHAEMGKIKETMGELIRIYRDEIQTLRENL